MQGDAIRLMLKVTDTLEKLRVKYAVGGSMASSVHGIMRATMAIDIVADLRQEQVAELVASLSDEFYVDEEIIREAIEHRSSFNLIHLQTAYKVDIFILKERPFDQVQLERRVLSCVSEDPRQRIYVTSPEDIILAKLDWYRMGGELSDRQWRDVIGVVKTKSGQLDLEYLRKQAKMLKIDDLLEQVLSETS